MNELIDLFKIIEDKGIPIAKLAKELDIPYDRVYQWSNKRGKPKADDFVKIQDWLKKHIHADTDEAPEDESGADKSSKRTIDVLYKLATANEKLADANQRLTIMLEDERVKSPAHSEPKTSEVFATMIGNLCEVVSEVAQGKKYKKEEVSAALYKAVPDKKKKGVLQGSLAG